MFLFSLIFFGLSSIDFSEAYKVLLLLPTPARSHAILADGIIRHLREAGHEVTNITPFPKASNKDPFVREIDISILKKYMPEHLFSIDKVMKKDVDMKAMSSVSSVFYELYLACLENENVTKLLNDPKEQFDVMILEWMFVEIMSGISAVFNCPYIWISTAEPHSMVMKLIDETQNPAYTTSLTSNNEVPLTYLERAEELFQLVLALGLQHSYIYRKERRDYERLLVPIIRKRGHKVPDIDEIRYNASLMLGNSHVSMGQPTRLPQNFKPVGGYHIDANIKPLTENLQKLLDDSKHGLIYFSMGSLAKSKNIPEVVKDSLLKMFGKLNYTVLWKFEEDLPNRPTNVHIVHWAPQQSILAHPNCILFITHGGLLSTTEAIHYEKPLIGIPIFGDQFNNIERYVKKDIAKRVDLSYNMADELEKAVNDILADPKYSRNVKALSVIYHDRPVSPGKELVHWVEHVVHTGGAAHLRSPALMMPWYQKWYLDLAALIIVILWIMKLMANKVMLNISTEQRKKKLL